MSEHDSSRFSPSRDLVLFTGLLSFCAFLLIGLLAVQYMSWQLQSVVVVLALLLPALTFELVCLRVRERYPSFGHARYERVVYVLSPFLVWVMVLLIIWHLSSRAAIVFALASVVFTAGAFAYRGRANPT